MIKHITIEPTFRFKPVSESSIYNFFLDTNNKTEPNVPTSAHGCPLRVAWDISNLHPYSGNKSKKLMSVDSILGYSEKYRKSIWPFFFLLIKLFWKHSYICKYGYKYFFRTALYRRWYHAILVLLVPKPTYYLTKHYR